MNIFGSVIAGTLVTVFLINLISTLLNLRASLAPLPTEFRDLYTDEPMGSHRPISAKPAGCRFSAVRLTLSCCLSSGFPAVSTSLTSFFGGSPSVQS